MNYQINSTTSTKFSVENELNNTKYLGLVFSGIGYTYRNPLLYYSRNILKEIGIDYIGIDYRYSEDATFFELKEADQEIRWESDNQSVIDSIITIEKQYKGLILIGKSMGTSVIRRCLKEKKIREKSICVLFTPGNEWHEFCIELEDIEQKILVIASKEDKYFKDVNNTILRKNSNIDIFEIERGNHSLEINDVELDIEILKSIIMKERQFININI